jgi:large subunit ribosomal protein L10Ae
MSKLSAETLAEAVKQMLAESREAKRGFVETVELQIALKNYDLSKEKRFSGTLVLPHVPRDRFKICILGNQKHIDEAKAAGIDFRSVDDLTKMNKNKKQVKKLANEYHAFLASADLIKKIPRLLGPGLNKAGKFPSVLGNNDNVVTKVRDLKASAKFQLKSKKALCMGVAVANVGMKEDDIVQNITLSVNFLVSLLKKNWQNVKRLYVKSTMGPVHRIFGF